MCLFRNRSEWFRKYLFFFFFCCCFFICIVRWRTSSIKPSWRLFLRANKSRYPPQIEDPRLHNETKKILEGFQGRIQSLRMSRVLSMAHKIIQHFGQLPVNRQGKPRQLRHACKSIQVTTENITGQVYIEKRWEKERVLVWDGKVRIKCGQKWPSYIKTHELWHKGQRNSNKTVTLTGTPE